MVCAHSTPPKPPARAQAAQTAVVWAGRIEPGPAFHNDSTAAVRGRIAKRLGEIACGRSDHTPNMTVTNRISQTHQGVRTRMTIARSNIALTGWEAQLYSSRSSQQTNTITALVRNCTCCGPATFYAVKMTALGQKRR